MTIRRGEPWGAPGRLPEGAPIARDDQELAELAATADEGTVVGLTGGDLHRTLGAPPPERLTSDEAVALPIDVLEVWLDDEGPLVAVAHVVARSGVWWRRETAVAMNAAFCGPLYLGPRAHPNDGLVDVTIGRLPFRDRRSARDRMRSGAHLPHPALRTLRAAEWSATLERPTPVSVDGVPRGTARRLRVVVRPDALCVVC